MHLLPIYYQCTLTALHVFNISFRHIPTIPTIHSNDTIHTIHTIVSNQTYHTQRTYIAYLPSIQNQPYMHHIPYLPYIASHTIHSKHTIPGGRGTVPHHTTPQGGGTVPHHTTPRGGGGDSTMADPWPWPEGGWNAGSYIDIVFTEPYSEPSCKSLPHPVWWLLCVPWVT